MNKQLLKMAGLATLVLLLHTPGFAQNIGSAELTDNDTTPSRTHSFDEITIRHKGDKDAKLTVEIKNGEVFINGKPASEYKDDNLTISKRRFKTLGDGDLAFSDGDEAMTITPFRNRSGVWNFEGKTKTFRESNQAFLGVTSLKPENGPDGAKIGEVSEGSAADKAGLKEGDLITKVDDKTIDGPESLSSAIHNYKPGDKVTITFKRDGKEQKATAELGKSKTNTLNMYGFDGKQNFDLSPELQLRKMMIPRNFNFNYSDNQPRLGIHAQDTEDGKGVKVLDVDDESVAAKAGIKEDDVITHFDGKEVNSATTLAELARESKTKPVVKVGLLRGGKPLDVEVRIPRKLKTADL
jgi:serine protease Do